MSTRSFSFSGSRTRSNEAKRQRWGGAGASVAIDLDETVAASRVYKSATEEFYHQAAQRKRTSLPSIPCIRVTRPNIRRRTSSAEVVKATEVTKARVKNYLHLARDFETHKPFAPAPDGTYAEETVCALCEASIPRMVFFPCRHKCVCDKCLMRPDINKSDSSNAWTECPVCLAKIQAMLPHTGEEVKQYWDWVLEVKPTLPLHFKEHFHDAGLQLTRTADSQSGISVAQSEQTRSREATQDSQLQPCHSSPSSPPMQRRSNASSSASRLTPRFCCTM